MKPDPHRRRLIAAGLAGAALTGARAADRPSLRIIVPASAGSGVDTILRAVAASLTRALGGQALVIENLAGAGGIPGTAALVKSVPDGNTIALVSNNHVVNPSVFKNMPYDTLGDITPIVVVGETPFVLAVNPAKVPARNAKELQAFLKARPGAYNYASSGNGTIIHLAGAQFAEAADVDVSHIPYKGMAPMVADIIGGQVEWGVIAVPVAQPHLKSGRLRAIGVTGRQRVASMPDLPTIAEQGFPGVDIGGWFAFVGPARLPAAEVRRLHAAVLAAFRMPEAVEAMARQENIINPMTPEASAQYFRTEQERYAKLAAKAGVKLE